LRNPQRGLAPRVFEYLFERIEEMQDAQVRLGKA
jgi:hypothetical protein